METLHIGDPEIIGYFVEINSPIGVPIVDQLSLQDIGKRFHAGGLATVLVILEQTDPIRIAVVVGKKLDASHTISVYQELREPDEGSLEILADGEINAAQVVWSDPLHDDIHALVRFIASQMGLSQQTESPPQ